MKKILTLFTALLVVGGIWASSAADASGKLPGVFSISATQKVQFAQGNLQYQQSSNTWRFAPNQTDWKGTENLQMGNTAYEGWVDLFCWSIGAENNFGATSAYNTALYENKSFVDWGTLFPAEDNWFTLSIDQWYYLLYTRANADNLWGMAMIDDNLGMVLLPDQWTAPGAVTFVPGTIPTTDLFEDADCLDPTLANQDHWRLNPNNLPANKFTQSEWAILETTGAVFLPYGGRRSGGYGNHTNRNNETISGEYKYAYYENYYGSYWTSTVRYPEQGKAYWLPLICNGCIDSNENWGRGSHGWWENGRYGHSIRLATPFVGEEVAIRTELTPSNYYTACWPKAMTAIKGGTLWQFISRDADFAYIEQVNAPFVAGKPYIVYATANKLEAIVSGDPVGVAGSNGALHGTFDAMNQATLNEVGDNIYLVIGNQLRRVDGQSGNSLPANRAYVDLDEIPEGAPAHAPGKNIRTMPMHKDATTGIDGITNDQLQMTNKVIIDGHLFILRGEKIYDTTGRQVK